ncbi:MAG: hypothetical protein D6812_13750, partial [Deltaproteobacteria bacterium]
MTMIWSPVKEEVFRFEHNFCVSAGAGSGKTAVLVELYLRFLEGTLQGQGKAPQPPLAGEEGTPPPACHVLDIVAITFTEKAAAEMKQRLREAIEQELRDSAARGDEAACRFWKEQKNDFSLAFISTFHSFCRRILREGPVEAGVDPTFSVLAEEEALALQREIVEAVVVEALDDAISDPDTPLGRLVRTFGLRGGAFREGLFERLLSVMNRIVNAGFTIEEVLARHASVPPPPSGEATKERLLESFRALVEALAQARDDPKGSVALRKRIDPACACLERIEREGLTARRVEEIRSFAARNWGKGQIGRRRREVKELAERWQVEEAQRLAHETLSVLLSLLATIAERYEAAKSEIGKLDFNDLQRKARDLLRDHPEVRNEYKRRFSRIMVDEFQDTNALQKEIVYYLAEDPETCAILTAGQRDTSKIRLARRKLFLVGDPKQSIYGFRGADVSVFKDVMAEMERTGLGKVVYFEENFRSQPAILEFVNAFFGWCMGTQPPEYDFEVGFGPADRLTPHREAASAGPSVELLDLSAGDEERETSKPAAERRKEEAEAIGRRILALVNGPAILPAGGGELRTPRFEDIALLFRRFTKVKTYEQAFRRLQIPFYAVKGSGFFQCQEIYDILNFLKFIRHPGDAVALAGVLRSPLVGVSDETLFWLTRPCGGGRIPLFEPFLVDGDDPRAFGRHPSIEPADRERLEAFHRFWRRCRRIKDALPLAELIEAIIEETGLTATLLTTFQGEQRVANLRKLIEMAREFESVRTNGFVEFVQELERRIEEKPREAEAQVHTEVSGVVRLMTIHQAKGLEFPIVFLPDIGQPIGKPLPTLLFDETGALLVTRVEVGGKQVPLAKELEEREKRREIAESKRIFYVAATRARDLLILSGERQHAHAESWRKWLDTFLEEEPGLVVRRRLSPLVPPEPRPVLYDAIPEVRQYRKIPIERLFVAPEDPQKFQVAARQAEQVLRNALYTVSPPASAVTTTVTALNDYLNCPRRFYYVYRTGIPERPRKIRAFQFREEADPALLEEERLDPQEQGTLAHAILEKIDLAADHPSEAIDELLRGRGYSPHHPDIREIKRNVLAFLSSDLGRRLRSLSWVRREMPFLLSFSDPSTAIRIFIKGVIDILYFDGRAFTVLDYKHTTAGEGNERVEIYRPQLWLYALAVSKWQRETPIRAQVKFLKERHAPPVDITPTPEELATFERRILSVVKEIGWIDRQSQYTRTPAQENETGWRKVPPEQCL